ncbi:IPTL-CTERM sorting domain-containing protein [Diaphorobacter caeni]|uniref:IPTL-CTERM sorting domain-containing protein n=1 Tax=Diaphorobacter caeni TaxID=2784387 RepID=UPI0018909815|nr:IPTL-CTERM sorting domain-containing protein [Diaphorobacter caeni]MBF5005310.1 IPTL-CTERM sorting domain-containing protein [Diaphorobacter caeni]
MAGALLVAMAAAPVKAEDITTVMGPQGCADKQMDFPRGIAIDKAGNMYVSTLNSVVCKRSVDGVVTLFAGTYDVWGFGGDGGPANQAELNGPIGMAVDASGNVFIADYGNNRIRKVDAVTGLITTVAGTADTGGAHNDGKPATQALLSSPTGVAFDSQGNLYIADYGHYHVRKVDASTQIIDRVAGNTYPFYEEMFEGNSAIDFQFRPDSIAFDSNDNLYVGDGHNGRVYKVDAATKTIRTILGNPQGDDDYYGTDLSSVRMGSAFGMVFDASDNLYIADGALGRVVRLTTGAEPTFSLVGGTGSWVLGGEDGPALETGLSTVSGIAIDAKGHLFITDSDNKLVRRIGPSAPVSAPAAPKNITTQSGDAQVIVSWDAPTGDEAAAGITGYTVTASPDGQQCSAAATETSCVVSGLSNGKAYTFTVVAINDVGPSPSAGSPQPVTPIASVALPAGASALPNATVGESYNAVIQPSGGTAPYQFRITSGSLPDGLTAVLSADGLAILISGTPTASGTAAFTMEIADSTVAPFQRRQTLAKAGPTLTTTTLAVTITVAPVAMVTPTATPVPTLSQWALVLLSMGLAGLAMTKRGLRRAFQ